MNPLTEFRHVHAWTLNNLRLLWLASLLLTKALGRVLRYALTVLVYLAVSCAGVLGVVLLGAVVIVRRAAGIVSREHTRFGVSSAGTGTGSAPDAPGRQAVAGGAPSLPAATCPHPRHSTDNILNWRTRIRTHQRQGGLLR
jgi:hypothetical protein